MNAHSPPPYPGSNASVIDLLVLAASYRNAAQTLLSSRKAHDPTKSAAARLCALHAIELYLNAFLRHRGVSVGDIRARCHSVEVCEITGGLGLRTKTRAHLARLTQSRSYLILRYAPDMLDTLDPITRVTATLDEVATKVTKACAP